MPPKLPDVFPGLLGKYRAAKSQAVDRVAVWLLRPRRGEILWALARKRLPSIMPMPYRSIWDRIVNTVVQDLR